MYSYNASWVNEALHKWGLRAVSLSMNANLPDQPPSVLNTNGHVRGGHESRALGENDADTGIHGDTYNVGRMLDVLGRPVAAPWMRTWNPVPYVHRPTHTSNQHPKTGFVVSCLSAGAISMSMLKTMKVEGTLLLQGGPHRDS